MLSLHTNAAALSTQNALGANNKSLTSSMTKLGTGFRINSAMDDAAGLQIANRLRAQNSGMAVAMRNTQNGISLMQTAEGALNEVNTMLVRMKDLATQSADASASAADKKAMQAEYDSLASEITNIIGNTTFGGEKLMNQKVQQSVVDAAELKADELEAAAGIRGNVALNAAGDAYELVKLQDKDGNDIADSDTGTGLGAALATAEMNMRNAQLAHDAAPTNLTMGTLTGARTAYEDALKEFDDKILEASNAKARHTALDSAAEKDDGAGKFSAALNFQIGATSSESMKLDLGSTMESLHKALGEISTKYTAYGVSGDVVGEELTGTDENTGLSTASALIDKLQTVLDTVGEMRSALGAASNRLEHTNSNLGNMSSTTAAAIGRIMDVDYATETSNMTKNQMLMQASSAMLKQSNSMSQMVASLLQ